MWNKGFITVLIAGGILLTAACGDAGNREPTEAEMRAAVQDSVQGGEGPRVINVGPTGASLQITHFEKLACERANGKPGYVCDYLFTYDLKAHSNTGTHEGAQHANAMNQVLGWARTLAGDDGPQTANTRFIYSSEYKRWIAVR